MGYGSNQGFSSSAEWQIIGNGTVELPVLRKGADYLQLPVPLKYQRLQTCRPPFPPAMTHVSV